MCTFWNKLTCSVPSISEIHGVSSIRCVRCRFCKQIRQRHSVIWKGGIGNFIEKELSVCSRFITGSTTFHLWTKKTAFSSEFLTNTQNWVNEFMENGASHCNHFYSQLVIVDVDVVEWVSWVQWWFEWKLVLSVDFHSNNLTSLCTLHSDN